MKKETEELKEEVEKGAEKAQSEIRETKDKAIEINKISYLGNRARWQNPYGGDRRSYETLLSLKETKDSEIKKIFLSEMEAIESVYSLDIMTLWIEQPIAICKFITEPGKQPCSEGFEPPIGYNADNVFAHLDRPLWTERARAACLLRNIRDPQNTNKDRINENKENFYDKLVDLMREEKENSLFVAKMALNTYSELAKFSPSGIFDFEGAIKDWENPERRKEILEIDL